MAKEGLSIVIPIYNEEVGIKSTIEELKKLTAEFDINYEIVLVNDGSTDNTQKTLAACKLPKNTQIVTHQINRGYGAALKTGIRNAQYNYICITDADSTYPNHRIPEFYDKIIENNYDMLVGARIGNNVNIPWIRRPAKWCLNKIANYLAERKIPDLNSGLRIMKRSSVLKFIHILPDGFSFTTTISLGMLTNNYLVHYEPIDYNHRAGSSKIRPIYDTLNFLQLIIRTVMYFNPLKIFLPVSLILFLASTILLIYRVFFSHRFALTASIFFIGGLEILALGMLADLIDKRSNQLVITDYSREE